MPRLAPLAALLAVSGALLAVPAAAQQSTSTPQSQGNRSVQRFAVNPTLQSASGSLQGAATGGSFQGSFQALMDTLSGGGLIQTSSTIPVPYTQPISPCVTTTASTC